jgi:hypothetical protein
VYWLITTKRDLLFITTIITRWWIKDDDDGQIASIASLTYDRDESATSMGPSLAVDQRLVDLESSAFCMVCQSHFRGCCRRQSIDSKESHLRSLVSIVLDAQNTQQGDTNEA